MISEPTAPSDPLTLGESWDRKKTRGPEVQLPPLVLERDHKIRELLSPFGRNNPHRTQLYLLPNIPNGRFYCKGRSNSCFRLNLNALLRIWGVENLD